MTPHRTKPDASSSYTPTSDDRRRERRDDADDASPTRGWFWRLLSKPSEIVVLISLLLVAAGWVGLRFVPPAQAVAQEAATRATADSELHRDTKRNASRLDSLAAQVNALADRLTFTNYMQCMQFKQTGAGRLPVECTTIIQQRLSP